MIVFRRGRCSWPYSYKLQMQLELLIVIVKKKKEKKKGVSIPWVHCKRNNRHHIYSVRCHKIKYKKKILILNHSFFVYLTKKCLTTFLKSPGYVSF